MQVNKIRIADNNGLVPAGAYFARLANTLTATNEREAAARERDEAREHKLEARYRRPSSVPSVCAAHDHQPSMI